MQITYEPYSNRTWQHCERVVVTVAMVCLHLNVSLLFMRCGERTKNLQIDNIISEDRQALMRNRYILFGAEPASRGSELLPCNYKRALN